MSSTWRWFGRTTLALLLVVGLPQFAQAAFIDLVSQTYTIHELVGGCCPRFPEVNEISATPISRTDNGGFLDDNGRFTGGFHISLSTNGGVTPLSAFVQSQAEGFDTAMAFVAVAQATAAITFRPLIDDVVVRVGNVTGHGPAVLHDDTAGADVLAFQGFFAPAAYNVSLNLTHLYTMYVSSSGSNLSQFARLDISSAAPVPESGSTLTFFVVGLGALLVVARSQKFRLSN